MPSRGDHIDPLEVLPEEETPEDTPAGTPKEEAPTQAAKEKKKKKAVSPLVVGFLSLQCPWLI